MWEAIRNRLVAKLFKDSFKQIEKINWCTKALEILFKQIPNSLWSHFIDGVVELLKDAIGEAEIARKWVK